MKDASITFGNLSGTSGQGDRSQVTGDRKDGTPLTLKSKRIALFPVACHRIHLKSMMGNLDSIITRFARNLSDLCTQQGSYLGMD